MQVHHTGKVSQEKLCSYLLTKLICLFLLDVADALHQYASILGMIVKIELTLPSLL